MEGRPATSTQTGAGELVEVYGAGSQVSTGLLRLARGSRAVLLVSLTTGTSTLRNRIGVHGISQWSDRRSQVQYTAIRSDFAGSAPHRRAAGAATDEVQPEPVDLHCQRPREQVGERTGPRKSGQQRWVQLLDNATCGRSGPLPPASCLDPANPYADCRPTDRPDRGTGSARLSGLRC